MAMDDSELHAAIAEGEPVALRAALFQMTGDDELLAMPLASVPSMIGEMPGLVDPAALERLRSKAHAFLRTWLSGDRRIPRPTPAELRRTMDMCVGETFSDDDIALGTQELGLGEDLRAPQWARPVSEERLRDFRVLIIGAGMGGLCSAIWLEKAGIPFVLVEKNDDVGGTWFENTYPDARVDLPSHWYHFTFETDYPWKHFFAPQREIRGYLGYCADKYDVRSRMRFGVEVRSLRFDESSEKWVARLSSRDGGEEVLEANAVISAVGMHNRPRIPDFEGMDEFAGTLFHTSQWDHSCELDGRRVSVVGTGASGMQLCPAIAPRVERLTIYQRTPTWVVPVPGYREPISPRHRWLLANFPCYANWLRFVIFNAFTDRIYENMGVDPDWSQPGSLSAANERVRQRLVAHMTQALGGDAELIRKCTPSLPPFVMRFVVDNGWFETLRRPNVDLVSEPIERLTRRGIRSADGSEIGADVIVMATGFRQNEFLYPMEVRGRSGITLEEFWAKDGARAYLGITVPRFPNLFCLYGPNTNPRSGHVCVSLELQARYAIRGIMGLLENDLRSLDCREDVYWRFNTRLDQEIARTVWNTQGNTSYYKNRFGRVGTNSPWKLIDYWRWTHDVDLADYEVR